MYRFERPVTFSPFVFLVTIVDYLAMAVKITAAKFYGLLATRYWQLHGYYSLVSSILISLVLFLDRAERVIIIARVLQCAAALLHVSSPYLAHRNIKMNSSPPT